MIRNPEFIMRSVANKQVLAPVGAAAENYHGMLSLNATGTYIWELLEKPQTEETLADALAEKYEVAREITLADVRLFIAKLRKAGAILE